MRWGAEERYYLGFNRNSLKALLKIGFRGQELKQEDQIRGFLKNSIHMMSVFYMPATILGARDPKGSKADNPLPLCSLHSRGRGQTIIKE